MAFRKQDIDAALRHLSRVDPVLRRHIQRVGPFTLKTHRDRFDLLVRSILSQQISTKAARAIRLRLAERVGSRGIAPESIVRLSDATLREIGLSSQKIGYLRDLAQHALSGKLELQRLGQFDDEAVIERLIAVRGIGRWTAQMFLIFALGRLDVLPHDDLGLRASLQELYGLPGLPDRQTCLAIAEPWSPYRSIATWYCWRLGDLKRDPDQDASVYPV